MTSYEFSDFAVPHDGTQAEISEREKVLAAQKFDSLVDDLLLNNAENVKHYEFTHQDSLLLELSIQDKDSLTIGVHARTDQDEGNDLFSASERIRRDITVQKIVNGYGRDIVSYRLFADGIVRRWDGGDMHVKLQEKRELGIGPEFTSSDMSYDEITKLAMQGIEEITKAIPNHRLERQMGVQNQAIGLAEVDGLTDLVTQPGIVQHS